MDGIVVKLIEQAGVAGILQILISGILIMWVKGAKKEYQVLIDFIPTMQAVANILPKIEKLLIKQEINELRMHQFEKDMAEQKEELKKLKEFVEKCRHENAIKGGC
jgi:hypothetical protein